MAMEFPRSPDRSQETWQSVHDNYQIPDWMVDGKLGIFIHFGLYSIPAHRQRVVREAHVRRRRPPATGTSRRSARSTSSATRTSSRSSRCRSSTRTQWAKVFKESGARWVMPTAEHHDGYSLWDSTGQPVQQRPDRAASRFRRRIGQGGSAAGAEVRRHESHDRALRLHRARQDPRGHEDRPEYARGSRTSTGSITATSGCRNSWPSGSRRTSS